MVPDEAGAEDEMVRDGPGKSAEVAIALLPARPRAVVVKGAKTPTASTLPATNAAAAASVSSGVNSMSCSVSPAFRSASSSR
jgi:hypothetical protein